eukprot:4016741-Amphidinium_carterae.1
MSAQGSTQKAERRSALQCLSSYCWSATTLERTTSGYHHTAGSALEPAAEGRCDIAELEVTVPRLPNAEAAQR